MSSVAVVIALVACGGNTGQPNVTPDETTGTDSMQLTSTAFEHEGTIPERYTCDGADVSPPLALAEVPAEARTLVLIMDDPDAPRGTWDHWVAYDIPPDAEIPEGAGSLGTDGTNSWGRSGYGGPCPPSGTHRYFFNLYALNTELGLAPGATKEQVLDAMTGHVVAQGTLLGRYGR
jgi:Raf kinase inhibitor-like YbhB/YbcL family protein